MIKIFQKGWFDIKFSEFASTTHLTLADTTFYRRFYEIFYERYAGWHMLPASYISDKQAVVNHLSKVIVDNHMKTIFSIGCGNGIIEKELIERFPYLTLFAYEPDEINFKWLKEIKNIQLCSGALSSHLFSQQYDLVYLSGVDPVLTNTEYLALLMEIKNNTQARVILTNVIKPYRNLLSFLSYWTKRLLFTFSLYDIGQLWGYLRHFHEHEKIIDQAGYKVVGTGDLSKGFLWIELAAVN